MKLFGVQGYLLISFPVLPLFTYRFFSIIVYNKGRKNTGSLAERIISADPGTPL